MVINLVLQLPDELQLKILAQLPIPDLLKATVVCHKWNELVYEGSLWSTINVTPFYKTIPIESILKLIKCSSRFLKTANFRGCIQLTGHGLRTLSEYCPNLQVLIIKDCRGLSAASIAHFLQRANELKVLDVSGLDTMKNSSLTSTSLNKLERLNMSWCRNMTGSGILSMITICTSLRYLKLNGCSQLDDITMSSLGTYLPNLSHLCLAACTSLKDTGLSSFLKNHSAFHLTHLNLSSCAKLTDVSLRNIAIYSTGISHLELAGCVLMTDLGFTFLSPRLRSLVHLDLEDLQHITDITVKTIANHQPHLVRFCLSNCTQISDDGIAHLVLNGICRELQHIELDNCTITDGVLKAIALYLEQQQSKLTNSSLFTFKPRKINVEVLDCSNITEVGVKEALAKASPMLTIKSFYSFQSEAVSTTHDDEVDNIHRHHSGVQTRRRDPSAGQHHGSGNCIIL
ncbi:hypothetical protein INT47_007516 [Mucor saturninus]|uniref:F-box domain-containing protein n=1 Tax=Mucor saturninus TaxID=64648 RepID=A0A8H7V5A8_9FUNG|nr:hypothetical protein INT47_007516 [Mucor saturninus]